MKERTSGKRETGEPETVGEMEIGRLDGLTVRGLVVLSELRPIELKRGT